MVEQTPLPFLEELNDISADLRDGRSLSLLRLKRNRSNLERRIWLRQAQQQMIAGPGFEYEGLLALANLNDGTPEDVGRLFRDREDVQDQLRKTSAFLVQIPRLAESAFEAIRGLQEFCIEFSAATLHGQDQIATLLVEVEQENQELQRYKSGASRLIDQYEKILLAAHAAEDDNPLRAKIEAIMRGEDEESGEELDEEMEDSVPPAEGDDTLADVAPPVAVVAHPLAPVQPDDDSLLFGSSVNEDEQIVIDAATREYVANYRLSH